MREVEIPGRQGPPEATPTFIKFHLLEISLKLSENVGKCQNQCQKFQETQKFSQKDQSIFFFKSVDYFLKVDIKRGPVTENRTQSLPKWITTDVFFAKMKIQFFLQKFSSM